jgi:DNA processing protein
VGEWSPPRRPESRPAPSAVSLRAACVWLGALASWRRGLVGRLVRDYGTVMDALDRPPDELVAWAAGRAKGPRARSREPAPSGSAAPGDAERFRALLTAGPEACLQRADRRPPGDLVVAWSEPLYPARLRQLRDPPLCLFVRGGDPVEVRRRLSALGEEPAVAVVGTRGPSPYGEEMARVIGRDLACTGIVVVSGLAMGVDAAAQAAAADVDTGCGRPRTVAVLGCGADIVYPRRNAALYAAVVASGLVVSEFAWGVPARAWRFPARNRIMAALARGVVLVEGTRRSGARITAGFAADLGREVLCVPGEAGRRLSEAPNELLRHGARICEGAGDVLRAIAVDEPDPGAGDPGGEDPGRDPDVVAAFVLDHEGGVTRDVLRALEAAPLTVDELTRRCGVPAAKVAAAVSGLEVEGLARREEGGRYRLRRRTGTRGR